MDALSLLLSFANVTSNSDVLVFDMVGGLITGAVAERLGGRSHPLSFLVLIKWWFIFVQNGRQSSMNGVPWHKSWAICARKEVLVYRRGLKLFEQI